MTEGATDLKWERLSLGMMTTTQILGSPHITLFLNSDHFEMIARLSRVPPRLSA